MIHSVWNLCRACPGKADEKVHTEYKRNYTWHSNYQPVDAEIIKKAPEITSGLQSAGQGSTPSTLEPQLPRKKKHPEVAYRNHQVLHYDYPGGESSDSLDSTASGAGAQQHVTHDENAAADILRARSEERGNSKNQTSSQRSRSADPSLGGRAKAGDVLTQEEVNAAKMTEYQLSFARRKMDSNLVASTGRGQHHQERGGVDIITGALGQSGDAANEEGEETPKRRTKGVTEYKAKFKPFSSYLYIDGNWRKPATKARVENNNIENGDEDVKGITDPEHAWYTEVVERIKKADEYRWRAHGTPIYGGDVVKEAYGPGAVTRQAELWSQVHDRTSLLALSLATTPKHPSRGDEKTPDRQQRAHKSPISGPALAAIHKREIRPVSVERKKSPAAEKKRPPAPASNEAARKTASAGSRPARHSSVAPPSVANRGSKREDAEGKTGRATSADPTTRRVAPPSTLLRTTAASEGKRITVDASSTDGVNTAKKMTSTKTAVAAHPRSKSKAPPSSKEQGTPVARPRPVVRPSAPDTATAAVNGDSDGKIWLKPASKDEEESTEEESRPEVEGDSKPEGEEIPMTNGALSPEMETESSLSSAGPGERRDVSRPCSLPAVNGGQEGQVNGQQYSSDSGPSPLPEPHTGPVPLTTVKSPEELTGIKSPDPESWTVSLETNRGLEWTDGHTPEPNRVKSPPLNTTPFKPVPNQPLSPQSSYEQVPTKPIKAFNADDVIGGLPASPDIDGTEAIPIGGELESGDVLDRARNRLDQFWSKSK